MRRINSNILRLKEKIVWRENGYAEKDVEECIRKTNSYAIPKRGRLENDKIPKDETRKEQRRTKAMSETCRKCKKRQNDNKEKKG